MAAVLLVISTGLGHADQAGMDIGGMDIEATGIKGIGIEGMGTESHGHSGVAGVHQSGARGAVREGYLILHP